MTFIREAVFQCPDGWTFGIKAYDKQRQAWFKLTSCPRPKYKQPLQGCEKCPLNPKNILKKKEEQRQK